MKPVRVYPEREGQKHSGKQGSEDQERKAETEEGENPTNNIDIIVFPKNNAKCNV